MTGGRWAAWWVGLVGVALLVATWVASQVAWERASTAAALWGDSYPNADQVGLALERIGGREGTGWGELLSGEVYQTGLRAPLLYVSTAVHARLTGYNHFTLIDHQIWTLALGVVLVFALLRALTGSNGIGWLAALLFAASPDTIAFAHTFFLEAPAVVAVALCLVGFTGLVDGRRWGLGVTAVGLMAALLSRQQLGALLVLPVVLYALPGMVRLLRARPGWLGVYLVPLPLLGVAVAWASAGEGARFGFSPPLGGVMMGLALGLGYRRVGDPRAQRDRDLCLALSTAACATLPWYLAQLGSSAQYLEGSSVGQHLRWASFGPLVRFQHIVLAVRTLTPVVWGLALGGLVWGLVARRSAHPTVHLSVMALLTAHLTYPLYFHARYIYPLLPFALVLSLGWWPRLGRLGAPLGGVLAVLALARLVGWAVPVGLPDYPPEFLYSEQTNWHERLDPRELVDARLQGQPRWARLLFTVGPWRPEDSVRELAIVADAACPPGPACPLYYTPPPRAFQPWNINYEPENMAYEIRMVRQRGRLIYGHATGPVIALAFVERPDSLATWEAHHPNSTWEEVGEVAPFGNMRVKVLRSVGKPSAGLHLGALHEVFRWEGR